MPLHSRFIFNFVNTNCLYTSSLLLSISKRYLNESYYDVLKIPESCSTKDVRGAFISLSKKYHPDKHLNDPSMHERFIRINEAYSVLINPLSRRAYDINLHQKKKLGAPRTEFTKHQRTYARSTPDVQTPHSSRTNYSSYQHGDPFTFHYGAPRQDQNRGYEEEGYYGIKGVKRISNNKIASVLFVFTLCAASIQLYTVRRAIKNSRDESFEKSRKNALLLNMVKEKAKLHGNDHQIDLLKKSLMRSMSEDLNGDKLCGDRQTISSSGDAVVAPVILNKNKVPVESCEKCKKYKRM